jgi:hypothetical protein
MGECVISSDDRSLDVIISKHVARLPCCYCYRNVNRINLFLKSIKIKMTILNGICCELSALCKPPFPTRWSHSWNELRSAEMTGSSMTSYWKQFALIPVTLMSATGRDRQTDNSIPMSLPLSASKPHIARMFLELCNNAASPAEVIQCS